MNLPATRLSQQELRDFNNGLQKEWIVTNGLGGYASSTALGLNTRKYHGLLVAALHPPGYRTVCLQKLDEEITVDREVYMLGCNEFNGAIWPEGFSYLTDFSVAPYPRYSYAAGQVEVEKNLFMLYKKNAVVAHYCIRNSGSKEAVFRVTPLVTCRHFHSVINKYQLSFEQQNDLAQVQITFEKPKTVISIRTTKGSFQTRPNWLERVLYREETARGESSIDDGYQPGFFKLAVPANSEKEFAVIASAENINPQTSEHLNWVEASTADAKAFFQKELHRQSDIINAFYNGCPQVTPSDWLSWALLAADTFIVNGFNGGKSVIAGYHWFERWGRDTFISLPGLLLVTRRFDEARLVLISFGKFCTDGLIPNFLSDLSLRPSCNTVDSSLWYVNSVLRYVKYTGDFDFVKNQLWTSLTDIIESHIAGTSYGIRMDQDGLLAHGPRLTWMDAEVNGKPVTPREGKAVEIQALWYNAIKTMQLLSSKFKEQNLADTCMSLAVRVKAAFNSKFWNSSRGCLFDVLEKSGFDASLRPNQVIAASLDFSALEQEKATQMVEVVQRELLTPCGLRTLERGDPAYRGKYLGDRTRRDEAYHTGTVWPWLLGPFTTAFLKTQGFTPESRAYAAENFIQPLFSTQASQAGLGTVNEVFDGEPPHTPRGCISQAWSIAEPLRTYVEDIMQIRPRFEREIL